jgi:hypothetical protein
VVERDGRLIATDALQKVFHFLASLDDEHMTSTASRLATVQREIENLEARLNPDRSKRADYLRKRIANMEAELARVKKGEFEVIGGARAAAKASRHFSMPGANTITGFSLLTWANNPPFSFLSYASAQATSPTPNCLHGHCSSSKTKIAFISCQKICRVSSRSLAPATISLGSAPRLSGNRAYATGAISTHGD